MSVFLLVVVWMGKLWGLSRHQPQQDRKEGIYRSSVPRSLILPLLLFVAVSSAQLVPLPPLFLSYLSPATYALYQRSLPGWPKQNSYAAWLKEEQVAETKDVEKDSQQDDATNATDSDILSPVASAVADDCVHCSDEAGAWMPLSLAPALTQVSLLKFLAYLSFFLLLLLYPVNKREGRDGERQFLRAIFATIVSTGFYIATIAIIQRYFWNGKILWFFIPEHWGSPKPELLPRASGPFVNSDHFANYLVLVIPLLLSGLFSPALFVTQKKRKVFAIFCMTTLIVTFTGLLLSLSRGGWVGAGIGVAIFLWFLRAIPLERRPQIFPWLRGARLYGLVACSIVAGAFALLSIDNAGLDQIDQRIDATLKLDTGLDARMKVWQGSVAMIRDFPLFGVGLGAWLELFPHYQLPPWSSLQWHEAHNDYLQCLAETGVIGFGLLGWFFCVAALRIRRGISTLNVSYIPVAAGILAALGGMAFHAGVDFSLQVPANALLFTALVALGLRIVGFPAGTTYITMSFFPGSVLRVGIGILALGLCVVAMMQKEVPYRIEPDNFTSVAEARANIFAFPARRDGHVALSDFQEERILPAELRKELEIAVWLSPLDPEIRDQYIVALLDEGRQTEALQEVRQSVFHAPALASHFYLESDAVSSLDPPERQAVEEGLRDAWMAEYPGALTELGNFYQLTNRPLEKARIYEKTALNEQREKWQTRYWLEAGKAYIQAGEHKSAEASLRQVIQNTPRDARAYLMLITDVFSVSGDITAARAVATEGISYGIDPSPLLLATARIAQRIGNREEAQAILQELIQRQPYSFDARYRLGGLYLQGKNFLRAVLTLKEAVRLRPNAAEAFFLLGQAEEAQYRYSDAQKAYTQALHFAPDNSGYRQRYEALLKKLQKNGSAT